MRLYKQNKQKLDQIIQQFKDKLEPEELEYLLFCGKQIYTSGSGLTYHEVRTKIMEVYGRTLANKYLNV